MQQFQTDVPLCKNMVLVIPFLRLSLLELGSRTGFFTETFLFPALKIWLLKKGHDMKQN